MRVIRYQDEHTTIRYAALEADGSAFRIAGDIFGAHEVTGELASVAKLLAPVAPTNILGIGRNYGRPSEGSAGAPPPEHPIVFMKATSAVQDPGAPICLPRHLPSSEVIYESELAVVIGRECRNVSREHAFEYVLGYTCANDVGAHDWQQRCGGQWWRGKSFDTFAPLGPHLVLTDDLPDPAGLRVRAMLNGSVTHEGSTSDMFFDVPALIEFLSADTTLPAGTVILTGCPPRVRPAEPAAHLRPGDSVTVEVEGIGSLTNPVIAAP